MHIITLSGTVALITSLIGLLPQVYKSLKTKSTKDISMLMLVNYIVCSFAWIIYGGYTDSMFVLVSNVVGLLTSFMLAIVKYYYDAKIH